MRPKTVDQHKLGEGVRIRLTELEKRLLLKRSQREGYRTISDFCRANLVKNREIRKIEVSEQFVMIAKKLDFELNKIGVNLNQVSRNMNAQHVYQFTSSDRDVFVKVLQEFRNCFSVLQKYMDMIE